MSAHNTTEDDPDPYTLLSIPPTASSEQIRRAYRQTSLKYHPDKNPSPEAATLFHTLTLAYNLLQDPQKRSELDASLTARRARAAQLAAASSKKRAMLEELERAERAAKRAKGDELGEEKRRKEREEEVKREGRRRREEAERRALELQRAREAAASAASGGGAGGAGAANGAGSGSGPEPPAIELTLLLRLPYPPPSATQLSRSLSQLGPIDPSSLLIRPPKPPKPGKEPKSNERRKGGTAVVQFLTRRGALAASQAGGRRDLGLEGVRVEWVGGVEPPWVGEAIRLSTLPAAAAATTTAGVGEKKDNTTMPSFDFDPSGPAGLDYESVTLARMRRAERERLERELREKEAQGEANPEGGGEMEGE